MMAAFCEQIKRVEGIEGRFKHQIRPYLCLGDYKYWIMVESGEVDLEGEEDEVLNRARLYRDRRDFAIQWGDTGKWEDYPAKPAHSAGETAQGDD